MLSHEQKRFGSALTNKRLNYVMNKRPFAS